ncbi:MAG: hypothetical protein OXF73_04830, partial [Gammaproteobacteria bacterium]|nr:hypothetical protein [Gammaproteobacteria bacterium]MCY4227063.1 hypothetical protein [Gammaproteobacteria bacterium]
MPFKGNFLIEMIDMVRGKHCRILPNPLLFIHHSERSNTLTLYWACLLYMACKEDSSYGDVLVEVAGIEPASANSTLQA